MNDEIDDDDDDVDFNLGNGTGPSHENEQPTHSAPSHSALGRGPNAKEDG